MHTLVSGRVLASGQGAQPGRSPSPRLPSSPGLWPGDGPGFALSTSCSDSPGPVSTGLVSFRNKLQDQAWVGQTAPRRSGRRCGSGEEPCPGHLGPGLPPGQAPKGACSATGAGARRWLLGEAASSASGDLVASPVTRESFPVLLLFPVHRVCRERPKTLWSNTGRPVTAEPVSPEMQACAWRVPCC